eukprot:g7522.t1
MDCAKMLTPSSMNPLRGGNIKKPKIVPKNSVPIVKPAGLPQRVDRVRATVKNDVPGGEFATGINVTEPRTKRRTPAPKPEVRQTPNIRINNIDASDVISNVKNELVVRKTKRAVEEAKVLCDRGARSFKNMIEILQRDVLENYLENVLEKRTKCKRNSVNIMLTAGRTHGSLALGHARNHTSVVEDTSLPLVVRRELLSAAESFSNAAEIMSSCNEELIHEGLRHNETEVPMSLWNAAAASAKAASRAFEICAASIAGTKSGHDDQSLAALVAAETKASILQSQLPEIPEPVENGSANECEADVCSIDRWADDAEKATRHVKQDGCLHGMSLKSEKNLGRKVRDGRKYDLFLNHFAMWHRKPKDMSEIVKMLRDIVPNSARIVSNVREPITHFASFYNFFVRETRRESKGGTLYDFARSTKFKNPLASDFGIDTWNEALRLLETDLEDTTWVLQDQYVESLVALRRAFNWDMADVLFIKPTYSTRVRGSFRRYDGHIVKPTMSIDEMSPELLNEIRRSTDLDRALYDYTRTKWSSSFIDDVDFKNECDDMREAIKYLSAICSDYNKPDACAWYEWTDTQYEENIGKSWPGDPWSLL